MIVSMVAALVGTEPDFDAGRRALAEVADREVFRFDEPEWQIPCLLDDVGECDLDEEGEFSLAILKRAAARILDRLETALDSRRTTTLEIGGYWVYLSGGLSWGDGPTVEYDAIADSDYLPCTVTTAIGFVNDPSKPIDPVKHRDDEASLEQAVTGAPREVLIYLNDPAEPAMICPHRGCDSEEFWEVDQATRWNPITLHSDCRGSFLAWAEGSNGDGYQHTGHLCQGCQQPVTMPDWLELMYG